MMAGLLTWRGALIWRRDHVAKQRHGLTDFLRVFEDVGIQFFSIETDLLVVLDERGNISRVNPAFEQTLGYREADVFGVSLISLVNVHDWAAFIKSFNALHPPIFRLLHSVSGESRVWLVAARFRQGRGFLVIRVVDD